MAYQRWNRRYPSDPFEEFSRLQDAMGDLFGLLSPLEPSGLFDRNLGPPVDIVEGKDSFTVKVDLPGVDRKDLSLELTGNSLTIRGERKAEGDQDKRKFFRKESSAASFQRTLALPDTVDQDKVDAELRDGVLTVTVAKKPEARSRRIAIAERQGGDHERA